MNFEQLGAGTLHIGFFFLLAAIAGLAAWALAASIEPTEQLWTRARNQLGERDFPFLDDYTWVTKTMIVWSWMCRKSLLASTLDGLWQEEKGKLMDERNEVFEERIPHFKRIMLGRTLLSTIRRLSEKLKLSVSGSTSLRRTLVLSFTKGALSRSSTSSQRPRYGF